MMFANVILFFGLLVMLFSMATSHPQCLDFRPPFSAEGLKNRLNHCAEYEEFGCCVKDRHMRDRTEKMLSRMPEERQEGCTPYLRNISCLKCSPYAAHIFEVESGGEERVFPILCRSYCEEAYIKCSSVGHFLVPLLRYFGLSPAAYGVANKPRTVEHQMEDAKQFCSAVAFDDTYCYPNIRNGPQIIDETDTQPEGEVGCVCGLPVATGLRSPVAAIHTGDGSGRLFIVEQIGVIRVLLADNSLLPVPFLNISSRVYMSDRAGEERGLMGLRFHPNYKENGRFFVCYAAKERRLGQTKHVSRVSEFVVRSHNPNRAKTSSERILLSLEQPKANHNGGELLFDNDGYLLVFFGDGGGGGDRPNNALTRSNWLGSAIRIDVDRKDSGKEYAIPADNPFVGDNDVKPEIYAYGLRMPWRCSIDRGDRETGEGRGRIFCGDVGQGKFEEVDIITKGGNYGWRAFEGNSCFDHNLCNSSIAANTTAPIHVYAHKTVGSCVIGGYVYRGCLFPNLRGLYIFGDLRYSHRIYALQENRSTDEWTRKRFCTGSSDECTGNLEKLNGQLLAFGEDEDGELYALTRGAKAPPSTRNGILYQLVDPSRQTFSQNCQSNIKEFPRFTAQSG